MIRIAPFRAWRPAPDKVHLVASRSFVSYTSEELSAKLRGNPFSFLHIVHPDMGRDVHLTAGERYRRVRRKFETFCAEGILRRDSQPSLYLYEQDVDGRISRGIICAASLDDYREGRIRTHEQTLTSREALFERYLAVTGINAEPVLLAAPDAPLLEATLDRIALLKPDHDFGTADSIRHRLWCIIDPLSIAEIQSSFAAMDALYIADGHHRCASSAALARDSDATGTDPLARFLAFIVPRSQLHIYNFDRVVIDTGALRGKALLQALSRVGMLTKLEGRPERQPPHGTVFIHSSEGWHALILPVPPSNAEPAAQLDAAQLSATVLGPVLGIHDLRTDKRVHFVPGTHGVDELEQLVRTGVAQIAFHLRPVDFEELKAVADNAGTMPPKSTWIEPKLRSGLVIYSLRDH